MKNQLEIAYGIKLRTTTISEINNIFENYEYGEDGNQKEMALKALLYSGCYHQGDSEWRIMAICNRSNTLIGAIFIENNIKKKECEVISICITGKLQKHGIGTLALILLIEELKSQGCETVFLFSTVEGKYCYLKLGFHNETLECGDEEHYNDLVNDEEWLDSAVKAPVNRELYFHPQNDSDNLLMQRRVQQLYNNYAYFPHNKVQNFTIKSINNTSLFAAFLSKPHLYPPFPGIQMFCPSFWQPVEIDNKRYLQKINSPTGKVLLLKNSLALLLPNASSAPQLNSLSAELDDESQTFLNVLLQLGGYWLNSEFQTNHRTFYAFALYDYQNNQHVAFCVVEEHLSELSVCFKGYSNTHHVNYESILLDSVAEIAHQAKYNFVLKDNAKYQLNTFQTISIM